MKKIVFNSGFKKNNVVNVDYFKITDSIGNKIILHRDYTGTVKEQDII